ncbi:unnamed protein product [Cylicocyclus nassatus]|uniref:Uncharacterized protein n=1 Tax=Cylicocyclus nassatus TaxID=53992 RepID=A0AA36GWM9_CYLNA|nr:unnamed protein product [Cylicocyclus nassatus]
MLVLYFFFALFLAVDCAVPFYDEVDENQAGIAGPPPPPSPPPEPVAGGKSKFLVNATEQVVDANASDSTLSNTSHTTPTPFLELWIYQEDFLVSGYQAICGKATSCAEDVVRDEADDDIEGDGTIVDCTIIINEKQKVKTLQIYPFPFKLAAP